MRWTIFALVIAGSAWSPAAAGKGKATFEDVLKEMVATLEQISGTLSTVKDEESAKAARPVLQKSAERFVALRKTADTIKPPTPEEKARVEKEYRTKLFEANKKLLSEIGRVRSVPGGPAALREIAAVLSEPTPKK